MPRSRRSKQSGRSAVTTVVTQLSQGWDRRLATQKDACHLSARVVCINPVGVSAGTAVATGSVVSPEINTGTSVVVGILGTRPFTIGANYLRYRINRLLACWRPSVGTQTNGRVGVGFLDDPSPSSSLALGSTLISDLRCSHEDSIYREVEVEWVPIDRSKWYYVDADPANSSSDLRFEAPCAVTLGLDNYGTALGGVLLGSLTLYYDITFEGAVDSSSSLP